MAEENKNPEVELDTDGVNEENVETFLKQKNLMSLLHQKKTLT